MANMHLIGGRQAFLSLSSERGETAEGSRPTGCGLFSDVTECIVRRVQALDVTAFRKDDISVLCHW